MNKKYLKHINTLFVVVPMSFIMAFVSHTKNHGFTDGCYNHVLSAWFLMLPVAYVSAFLLIPPARKLAEKVCEKTESKGKKINHNNSNNNDNY